MLLWLLAVAVASVRYICVVIQSTQSNDARILIAEPIAEPKPFVEDRMLRGMLHDRTTVNLPLGGKLLQILPPRILSSHVVETTELFAQHSAAQGIHLRMKNSKLLDDITTREKDSVLVLVALNNHESWGEGRTVDDLFTLLANFTHPQNQTSLAILTSSIDEFNIIQERMRRHIDAYAQFNLIFRHDFRVQGLTRGNRHADEIQAPRRAMLARYRNFLLLSALETWHQHVLWLDADVHIIPGDLLATIIQSGRDIVEPRCNRLTGDEFDYNAWVGDRRHMDSFPEPQEDYVRLDSVGGTMLYVRADIHRQGVIFPHFFVIGAEWEKIGNDGIETEGLCYEAHFLGYKCWGMPHHIIYHI